jgi:carbon storage regulator
MLVLSRTVTQEIMIGDNIRIMVIEVRDGKVRLGITAPRDVPVHRHEIYETIKRDAIDATDSDCD